MNEKDEIWSGDLVVMPPENLGRSGKYKCILTVIDLCTRYSWGIPLKTKTGTETKEAFDKTFKTSGRKPQKVRTDAGREFSNSHAKSFLKQNNTAAVTNVLGLLSFLIEF